jgi:calcium channel MID1
VTLAQISAQESLTLNTLYSFSGASLSSDPTFSLPQAQQLTVSVAICSTGTTSPAFFVNNNTASTSTTDDFEIPLHSGFGNWTGTTQQGGLLVVQNVGQTSFQVAASTGGMYSE